MRGDIGLVTLEWLLVVGAIAGIAASSVLAVQRVVDDTTEVPDDPLVRVLDADIAAAFIASEAQASFDASHAGGPPPPPAYVDGPFEQRCETGIGQRFGDVVAGTPAWEMPTVGADGTYGNDDDVLARCTVTPLANLGG